MKRIMTAAFVCAAILAGGPARAAGTPETAATAKVGEMAPDFTLTDSTGKAHSLHDYKGKIVVLEWTNHECPYVRKFYDTDTMQMRQAETVASGVVWLTIASSAPGKQGYLTAEETEALIAKEQSKATARLLDPEGTVGRMYGAKTTPHMFVIDGAGILAYDGAIDSAPSADQKTLANAGYYVGSAISAIETGKDVNPAQTKPYGCGIKYAD